MQFGSMPEWTTTNAIFIVRQLRENFCAINKTLDMAFIDLEKALDHVPRCVIWWALRKFGIEEWLVPSIQSMYRNDKGRVRVCCNLGAAEGFHVNVEVHRGFCLSPLLFIAVLEALSNEFHTECPRENLYTDGLVIISQSWKSAMKGKGLRAIMGKTNVLTSGPKLDMPQKSRKTPVVCVSRVSAQTPSFVEVVLDGSTRNAVVPLALWSLIPPSGINYVLDWPDQ